jgi:hypothetical protein
MGFNLAQVNANHKSQFLVASNKSVYFGNARRDGENLFPKLSQNSIILSFSLILNIKAVPQDICYYSFCVDY